jgi:hypothetical protein
MAIQWTRNGDEWSEPSGRFLIVGKNRRYELIESEQGSIMRRAGKLACMCKAEEMAAASEDATNRTPDAELDSSELEDQPEEVAKNEEANAIDKMRYDESQKQQEAAASLIAEIAKPSAPKPAKMEAPVGLNVSERAEGVLKLKTPVPPSPEVAEEERIQGAVDVLIRTYDEQVFQMPSRLEAIKRAGIKAEDLTPARVNRAHKHRVEWLKQRFREHNADPNRAFDVGIDGDPEFDARVRPETKSDNEPVTRTNESEEPMKVAEAAARNLLVAVGLSNSSDRKQCPLKNVLNRVNKLDKLQDEDLARANGTDHAKVRDSILEALAAGKKIEVAGHAESNGAVRPAKEKKAKGKKATKGKSGGDGEAKADRFGARLGSRKAQINSLLSPKVAKTAKQIREEGNIPGSYVEYFDELKKKGIVKGNHEEGFTLAK